MAQDTHTHQSALQISFVLYTFPGWDVPEHPAEILVLYKRRHPQMKFVFPLSRIHFSLRSMKSISCADSSTLCAFWQQPRGREVFKDGKVLAEKGFGKNVRDN
jgi:hypothetical protein